MPGPLNSQEKSRYSRHLLLENVGLAGQMKLKQARVLIIGLGGLGNPAASYLAASGVGTLGLLDADEISMTNLHRQILFQESDVGKSKVSIAAERLAHINPHIQLIAVSETYRQSSSTAIVKGYDIIIDCTDNFEARYAINSISFRLGIPLVHGSIYRFEGQVSVFNYKNGPCYRCIYPNPPPQDAVPNCATAGVLGVLPGTVGTLQATEAIKIILGLGRPLAGRLLTYDALNASFQSLRIPKDPECPMCKYGHEIEETSFASCQAPPQDDRYDVDWHTIKDRERLDLCLIDIRSQGERDIICIPHSLHVPVEKLLKNPKFYAQAGPMVLYCQSGARSRKAVETLREKGFNNFSSLKGGVRAWQDCQDAGGAAY